MQMKAVILYESFFGNTKKIAIAMTKAQNINFQILEIRDFKVEQIENFDLLVLGSPTRGFRPCEETKKLLQQIPSKKLSGKKVAAFDTRIELESISSKSLRFIVKTGGYAAKHITKGLQKKGGILIAPPEGFLVTDEKGPLKNGEEERAAEWANNLLSSG